MEYVLYLSTAMHPSSDAMQFAMLDLYDALMQRFALTGMLLYADSVMLHYLEGHSSNLMYARLLMDGDAYQRGDTVLDRGLLVAPLCQRWQMAYRTAHPPEHLAYSPLLSDRTAAWPQTFQGAKHLVPLRNFRARAFGDQHDSDLPTPLPR